MGRVAGVFDNPPGFPCTPPGVDVLEGGKLTSNNVAGSSHDPLQSFAVASGAVSQWWSVTKYNYFVTVLKYIFQVSVLYWSSFILSNFYFYFTTFQSIRS